MSALQTRVLIEHENPWVREAQVATLEAAGFEVVSCPGPAEQDGGTCPLVGDGYCQKALTADVIVNGLPIGHLRVYVAQNAYLPDCPVLLSLNAAERGRHPILDSLAITVPRNLTGAELVDAVRAVVDEAPGDADGGFP